MHRRFFDRKQIEKMTALLAVLALAFTMIVPTLAYIVTMTSPLVNTFLSGLTPEGDLIIKKMVEHPFAEHYEIPENIEFTFQVNLGSGYAGKVVDTTKGEKTVDANGVITVSVKPGAAVAIRSIVDGTSVTVTEIQNLAGFKVKDGKTTQTVTIDSKEDAIVSFVNTYIPQNADSAKLNVFGVKTLVGRDWQEGDTFTFQLDYRYIGNDETDWIKLGTESVVYENDETELFNQFDFSSLVHEFEFAKHGVYAFRVSEVEGSIGGITYDDVISYFDVLIGDDDMDGMLEIQDVSVSSNATVVKNESANSYDVTVAFTNRYAPVGSAEVTIPIDKTVIDQSGQNKSPAGFAFELYDADGQLIKVSEATSAAGETSIRLIYDASEAGKTYTYTLKEVDGGQTKAGMIYDHNSYEFTVTIIDNLDGTVSAVTNASDVVFVNTYDPLDASMSITGSKELTGRELNDQEFRFNLFHTASDFAVGQDALPIDTAVNHLDGTFTFDAISFDKVGSYYYVVKEDTSDKLGGVIYDEAKYAVTVIVTDHNGVLKAQCMVTDTYGEVAQIVFYNVYDPEDTYASLGGRKELQGADLTEAMFNFELYQADDQFAMQGEVIQTVHNNADGTFRFENLTYDTTGIYHYVVLEDVSEQIVGFTYDSTIYGVTVTVTDDGNGKLTATTELTVVGGTSAEEIVFINKYTPEDDPTQPGGSETPPTGDRSHVALYALIAGVSILALILLLTFGKQRKRK